MNPINFEKYTLPYPINKKYQKRTVYFSMEFAIDQPLKIFSGGLGFLAGSHLRSAYDLKQNFIAVGILWKYGYYDQVRKEDNAMSPLWQMKAYNFLVDTGIKFQVEISDHEVWVAVKYLPPHVFGSAPLFLLTTDIPENDFISRTITGTLYDSNPETKIAQSIILGVGGAKLVDLIGFQPDVYHLNEAHGLSAVFYLYDKYREVEAIRSRLVFTTHTPVAAGNEKHPITLLERMSFFQNIPLEEVRTMTGIKEDIFDHTLVALRLSRIANGVSAIHGQVSRKMWSSYEGIAPIIHVTNSQHKNYWTDEELEQARVKKDSTKVSERKKVLKSKLFSFVADQTGKIFDPNVLTIVWARRFAGYKRADLITRDIERFETIFNNPERPVQIIWAGKPYPKDQGAITTFNNLVSFCRPYDRATILTGYEMKLSAMLKQGCDIWLNNPRIPQEASGTSGMTASMNGAINVSTWDGWIPEYVKNGENGFVVPPVDYNTLSEAEQDAIDLKNILDLIEFQLIPMYYDRPKVWAKVVLNSMNSIVPFFDSNRMADEYYAKMYN